MSTSLLDFPSVNIERLDDFIIESFNIENIHPRFYSLEDQHHAAIVFLTEDLTSKTLLKLLSVIQPHAKLRDKKGMDVCIGQHFPPVGGGGIFPGMMAILTWAADQARSPYENHLDFESLHPFTDGNGRTGRMLWLWQMIRSPYNYNLARLFLHEWYYSSLR